jgi:hypothetical protein
MPTCPDDDQLAAALNPIVSGQFGREERITSLTRSPSAYRTSFGLENLLIETKTATVELVFKDLSRRCLRDDALRAKPAFLYDPMREIGAYRTILGPANIGAPTYFGSVVEPEHDRFWLFLGRAPGVEIYQVGDLSAWQDAARWLAGFHAQFDAKHTAWLDASVPLLRHDRNWYALWLRRALEFRRGAVTDRPENWHSVTGLHDRLIERLLTLPVSLLHGEFFASNVLVEHTPAGWSVHPVDWEMAAVGPGLFDLAALVAGGWTEQQKRHIALAYLEAATHLPAWLRDEAMFWQALTWCRLQLAVQWLGWSADWIPPAEHAHDWAREAEFLLRGLVL